MSPANGPLLDAEQIRGLLNELGGRLAARGLSAQLFLVGGAVIALAFNTRRATRDLDAIFEPKSEVYAEAAALAAERGLPGDWLNDGVKGLLPDRAGAEIGTRFEAPGISVGIASAEYLFAMKASAARGAADFDDLRFLADYLGLRTATAALDLVERYYSPERLRPTTPLMIEDLFANPGSDS